MIQHHIGRKKDGIDEKVTLKKAEFLRNVMGYNILSIEYKQAEDVYDIVVDTDGYPSGIKRPLPEIVEK